MSDPNIPQPKRWTATAIALFAIGLLILVPSGLCSALMGLVAIAGMFASPSNESVGDGTGFLFSVVMVGGPFILVGALLVYGGLRARKSK